MAEFHQIAGGKAGSIFKDKKFLIAAAVVAVLGVFTMMRKGSSSSSSQEEIVSGEANYPSVYGGVDTQAQMQQFQSIQQGYIDQALVGFYNDMTSELKQQQVDIGDATDLKIKTATDKINADAAKANATKATVQTDFFGKDKWKANYVYKTLLSNGAKSASVKQNSSGSYYVVADFTDSAKADAAAQNAIKQINDTDKRIGFKNYSKTVVK